MSFLASAVDRLTGAGGGSPTQGYQPLHQPLTVHGLEEEEDGDQSVIVPVAYEMAELKTPKTPNTPKTPRSELSSPAPHSMRWVNKRQQQRNKRNAQIMWSVGFLVAMAVAGWALRDSSPTNDPTFDGAMGELEEYAPLEVVDVAPAKAVSYDEQYAAPDLNRFTGALDSDVDYLDEDEEVAMEALLETEEVLAPTVESDVPAATTSAPAMSEAPTGAARTKVRARRHNNLYSGCSSNALLSSLKRATINQNGASRSNYTHPTTLKPNKFDLDSFEFSYDLPDCPAPHVFTPAETCDLLSSFGGVYIRGDSLMRQFAQGIFLLLKNSFDLVESKKKECAGNDLFTNGRECKFVSYFDSREFESVCGEEAYVLYQQVFKYVPDSWKKAGEKKGAPKSDASAHETAQAGEEDYTTFLASLPPSRQKSSPLYIHGTGIHYSYDPARAFRFHIDPFSRYADALPPAQAAPLKFFSLALAPGANKPERFLATQGPERTKQFNDDMGERLDEFNTKSGRESVAQGAWAGLDWFGTSDGAASFDGTHYSYQVVMERAQVFLNLLDVVHAEIVADGGLIEEAEVMELEA